MGMMRQLSVTEILGVLGTAHCSRTKLPEPSQCCFHGHGRAARQLPAVEPAIRSLTDQRMHGFGARHVTLSTVGPSAEKIKKLKGYRKLAWSIHATRDAQ